jgi:hypothetical protein
MNGLERSVFERSVAHLRNKHNGMLVKDDELISSRASDVKAKTISNQQKQLATGKQERRVP